VITLKSGPFETGGDKPGLDPANAGDAAELLKAVGGFLLPVQP
jgi:hypothetical protein